jgi:hypothetical protein
VFKFQYKDIGWWYWVATTAALTFGAMGGAIGEVRGFSLALAVTAVHLLHYLVRYRSFSSFPVQVRSWLVAFMLVGLLEPMGFIYWMLTAGGWAQILFGYCLMARMVSLLPWNRTLPFDSSLLKTTFLSRPTVGSVRQGFAEQL